MCCNFFALHGGHSLSGEINNWLARESSSATGETFAALATVSTALSVARFFTGMAKHG